MGILAGYMVPHPPAIIHEISPEDEYRASATVNGYRKAMMDLALLDPDTIIITSPHSVMYRDYNHISPGYGAKGDFRQFGAPQVSFQVEYDRELVAMVCREARNAGIPAGTKGEKDPSLDHGTMVPLYFIEKAYQGLKKAPEYRIVRIGLSGQPLLDQYVLGMLIRDACENLDRRAVFVASGDLSHYLKESGPYGFRKEGPEYDRRIMETMRKARFEELLEYSESFLESAGECGHRSFTIMAGAFDTRAVDAAKYSYDDITGVGYGICGYHEEGKDFSRNFGAQFAIKEAKKREKARTEEDEYVRLARKSLESWINDGKKPAIPEKLPEELTKKSGGVFVSLHLSGQLRGCIGTIRPVWECVALEIIENAISAGTRDPRFHPVTPEELDQLEISVDILGTPEKIQSPEELDIKRYGVIVTSGDKVGLLLPDIDGIRSAEQQIRVAEEKAGIIPGEEVQLERFEVKRHH